MQRAIWLPLLMLFGCEPPVPDAPRPPEPPPRLTPPTTVQPSAPTPPPSPTPEPKPRVQTVPATGGENTALQFRESDTRPIHDDARLEEFGIRRFESKHLRLYTDIAPEIAAMLPPLVDALYLEWERYFGPLPSNREGTPFQMTGYVMKDRDLFTQLGLLPEDLPDFIHGRHRGAEFWMNEQQFDYYRRHLLLHEATHCFMGVQRDERQLPPVWYMEGMAELFSTHRLTEDGPQFRIFPDNKDDFAGLGRITLVQSAVAEGDGQFLPLNSVLNLTGNDFVTTDAYAWSWALCQWLDKHPRYRERFQRLGGCFTHREFTMRFQELFGEDAAEMSVGWGVFATTIQDGYDIARAAVEFADGVPLAEGQSQQVVVHADRGWQSSGIRLARGEDYRITAVGQFTLATEPKPWPSEPQGISFDYFNGRPLGCLLAAFRDESPGLQGPADGLSEPLRIGSRAEFTAPTDATLYFRLNDEWSRLADNAGSVTVTVARQIPMTNDQGPRFRRFP